MRPHSRLVDRALFLATIVGGAVAVPLIWFFPPDDSAAAHAKATTPFALAVTSPVVDKVGAVFVCLLFAWMLALALVWVFWPGNKRERGAAFGGMKSTLFCMILVGGSLRELHRLPDAGALSWILFVFLACGGVLGLADLAIRLATAWKAPSPTAT
jgi:hypothetical protein